ncbi:transmembrane protein 72 [Rhinoraja longicauda]
MATARVWDLLDRTCRILGIITAAVLLGVGILTAVEAQFTKLAAYLLFAAVVLTLLEGPYFIDVVLVHCCPSVYLKTNSKVWTLWKKALRPNGFQKFLTFIFLSVPCFLHPVLIWQATIPGSLLIVSGLAYFVLNLRKTFQRKVAEGSVRARCSQAYVTAVAVSEAGQREQMYSFQQHAAKKRFSLINHVRNIFKLNTERPPASEPARTSQANTARTPTATTDSTGPLCEEGVIKMMLSEAGDLEEPAPGPDETTSDKVLIISK